MKKIIRYLLVAGIVTALLPALTSCSKQDNDALVSPDDFYIQFKVDGTTIKYGNAEVVVNVTDNGSSYATALGGSRSATETDKNTLAVLLSTGSPVVTGITYTNYSTTAAGHIYADLNILGWVNSAGEAFSSWPAEFANTGVVSDTKIQFTEITAGYAKGTFSGTLYKEISGVAEKHIITGGTFYAKRLQ